MAGYDPELDKLIWTHFVKGDKNTELAFSIYQYGEHPPKLGLARRYFSREEARFKKLGRISKEEAQALLESLPLAIEKLTVDDRC